VTPDSRNQGPGRSSPEVRFPCRAGPRPGCPCFGVAAAAHAAGPRSASSGSPLLGFLLPRTHDDGCPLSPGRSLTGPLEWVRVARPPPVPSSGFLPLSTVLAALAARTHPLRSVSFAVAPRRFAALFHAARVPGVALQSFPFPRSRTRSRGPVLPCGFAVDCPTARHARALHDQFPHRANPFAATSPKVRRTHGPGQWFLVVARRCQCAPRRARPRHRRSRTHRARLTAAGTPASKLCSPRESVHVRSEPWPGSDRAVGALLGLGPL
jgi:hypothetical protein